MRAFPCLLVLVVLSGCSADKTPDPTEVVDATMDIAAEVVADISQEDTVPEIAPDIALETLEDIDIAADSAVDVADARDGSDSEIALPRAALPPWLGYCEGACATLAPLVLAVCPAADPECMPVRATTIVPSVDSRPISAVAFPLGLPEGATLRFVAGNGVVISNLVTAYAPRVELHSDLDVTISYYALAPVWGGTVALDFISTSRVSDLLDSVFYRHPSYDTGTAADDLHTNGRVAIADERAITGVTSEHVRAFFMPMELAAASGGEGNFSYGDGVVTSNYGNPPYIDALGGIMPVAFPRFAHECAHELFDEVRAAFTGNTTCLNEGIADALAFVAGHLPEQDFGPIGLRGGDFNAGCADLDEVHDVGNCYFWQAKNAGLLTPDFMHGIFHPEHVFDFDSCDQHATQTGNALLVYFTEAANGADVIPVLDAIGVPHAASYEAALAALSQ